MIAYKFSTFKQKCSSQGRQTSFRWLKLLIRKISPTFPGQELTTTRMAMKSKEKIKISCSGQLTIQTSRMARGMPLSFSLLVRMKTPSSWSPSKIRH